MRLGVTHANRISNCLAGGTAITALASLFYVAGGELFAVPGMIVEGWINLVAWTQAPPDEFPQVLSWHYYSVVFYAVILYAVSWAYTLLREERENPSLILRPMSASFDDEGS
jgi:hypothetical protein